MANKSLFKSVVGRFLPPTDTRNEAGGNAYAFTPEHALAQYAATGCTNSTFYASAQDQVQTVLSLAQKVDPAFVAKVVLVQSQDVPADASVLVVAGPTSDFLPPEGEMLKRYLARGGHVLVLLDPPEPKSGPMPVLEGLLKEWAIEAGNHLVNMLLFGAILGAWR